jgi:hypothetical protein
MTKSLQFMHQLRGKPPLQSGKPVLFLHLIRNPRTIRPQLRLINPNRPEQSAWLVASDIARIPKPGRLGISCRIRYKNPAPLAPAEQHPKGPKALRRKVIRTFGRNHIRHVNPRRKPHQSLSAFTILVRREHDGCRPLGSGLDGTAGSDEQGGQQQAKNGQ